MASSVLVLNSNTTGSSPICLFMASMIGVKCPLGEGHVVCHQDWFAHINLQQLGQSAATLAGCCLCMRPCFGWENNMFIYISEEGISSWYRHLMFSPLYTADKKRTSFNVYTVTFPVILDLIFAKFFPTEAQACIDVWKPVCDSQWCMSVK